MTLQALLMKGFLQQYLHMNAVAHFASFPVPPKLLYHTVVKHELLVEQQVRLRTNLLQQQGRFILSKAAQDLTQQWEVNNICGVCWMQPSTVGAALAEVQQEAAQPDQQPEMQLMLGNSTLQRLGHASWMDMLLWQIQLSVHEA